MTNATAMGPSLYLDLLKKCLTGTLESETYRLIEPLGWQGTLYAPFRIALNMTPFRLVRKSNPTSREDGRDWPAQALTMVGLKRLDNLEASIAEVIRDAIPGDLIETGVWRGGASILMRGVLQAYAETKRTVWVADSFQGLPRPDAERYPADRGDHLYSATTLAVPLSEVKANFSKYGLLDDQVRFLPGWFADTLPTAPIERLAILRLDGDMYGSTFEALAHLYPKLSVGGFAIIDDYALPACRRAVDDYRLENGIAEPIELVDWTGAYWRRAH